MNVETGDEESLNIAAKNNSTNMSIKDNANDKGCFESTVLNYSMIVTALKTFSNLDLSK